MTISDPLYGAVPNLSDTMLSVSEQLQPNSISMTADSTEMLRVAKDGFYVRGKKVPVDDKEAETVYNAFLQWMSYTALTRNY